MKKHIVANEIVAQPSRRSALQLLLGGCAVAIVDGGRDWSITSARAGGFSDGLPRARPEDRGTHTIELGLAQDVEGDTTMTGHKLHHEYEPDVMRVVARGEWRDARTFVMTWTFVESAFRDTVTCVFTGPKLRFSRSVNVNSAETELPTLTRQMQA